MKNKEKLYLIKSSFAGALRGLKREAPRELPGNPKNRAYVPGSMFGGGLGGLGEGVIKQMPGNPGIPDRTPQHQEAPLPSIPPAGKGFSPNVIRK